MIQADIINGAFELLASFAILLTILKLRKAKTAKSVSVPHVLFFVAWGGWNIYYYPSLDQWFSAAAGVLVVFMNSLWVGMLIYYGRKERQEQGQEKTRASLNLGGQRGSLGRPSLPRPHFRWPRFALEPGAGPLQRFYRRRAQTIPPYQTNTNAPSQEKESPTPDKQNHSPSD